ncbi:MAG: DEAD/DEAH box helicase [Candidatus Aenigmarchaeota archaeon]|nr:DEAD/DEAH box helicase [Candidatus Aenigmarchaeota archaeon]
MKFEDLKLNPLILKQIRTEGFEEATEIQARCIPEIQKGKDIVGQSVTGSGKTVAFCIPIMEKIIQGKGIQTLILTPTRELCIQVKDTFETFGRAMKLKSTAVYGGAGMEEQIRDLKRTEIVVATPGRLLDHIGRRTIDMRNIKYLILDEVDKMFEMGFIDDVDKIIKNIPKERQTLLFSATMPKKVHTIINRYLKDPVIIKGQVTVDRSKLNQTYYDIEQNSKFSLLTSLIKKRTSGLSLIFCGTRHQVDSLTSNLKKNSIKVMAIHGGLTQNKRIHALESLKNEKIDVLVATDVAARGLDIKNVTHVYNYDVPKTSEEYIHRIGRTARAGKNGDAVTLLCDRDYDNFRRVLSDKSLKVEKLDVPQFEKIRFDRGLGKPRTSGFGGGGYKGGNGPRRSGSGSRSGGYGQRNNNGPRKSNDGPRSGGYGQRSSSGPRSGNDRPKSGGYGSRNSSGPRSGNDRPKSGGFESRNSSGPRKSYGPKRQGGFGNKNNRRVSS